MEPSSPRSFSCSAVVGDVAAFFDFKTAQGHADAAGAVGERVGFAAGIAFVDGLGATEFDDAAMPRARVLPLGTGKVAQDLRADGIGVAIGEGVGRCGSPPSRPASWLRGRPEPSSTWRDSWLQLPCTSPCFIWTRLTSGFSRERGSLLCCEITPELLIDTLLENFHKLGLHADNALS